MLHRVLSKVFFEPWAIESAAFESIWMQLHERVRSGSRPRVRGEEAGVADGPMERMAVSLGDHVERSDLGYLVAGRVAVVPVFGVLGKHLSSFEMISGGASVDALVSQLEDVRDREDVEAVVLEFSSPGGVITGIPEAAELVRELSDEKVTIAYTEAMMASAAYWIGSQAAGGLYMAGSADIGSVGVYVAFLDQSKRLEMEGLKLELIKSGEHKAVGMPGTSLTDEQRDAIQAEVDAIGVRFRTAVQEARPQLSAELLQGQTMMGWDAVGAGFADGIRANVGVVVRELQAALG